MEPRRPRTYSRDEMDEILRRALARQQADGVTHDELVAAAREVGIDPGDIDAAAAEVAAGREITTDRDARAARARSGFYRSLAIYLLVNAFLFGINIVTGGRRWIYFVMLGWGLAMAMKAVRTFFPHEETPEEAERRRLREAERRERLARHEMRRREKLARMERKQEIRRSAEQFEQAVEQGVSSLLTALARHVEKQVDAAGLAPRTDPRSQVRVGDVRAPADPVAPAHPTEREAQSVARGEVRRERR